MSLTPEAEEVFQQTICIAARVARGRALQECFNIAAAHSRKTGDGYVADRIRDKMLEEMTR